MRQSIAFVVGLLVLAAAGFAFASIASGSSSSASTDTVTTTAPGQTVTTTVTRTRTVVARVTICHRTGKKRPFAVTRRVSANTLYAHFRHGDLPGRCTAAKIKKMKKMRARR